MARTRLFQSGNSQAVRIPTELAYADTDIDLKITRLGDVFTIVPARNSLKDAVSALRRMPKPSPVEKRSRSKFLCDGGIEGVARSRLTLSTPISPFMPAMAPMQFLSSWQSITLRCCCRS